RVKGQDAVAGRAQQARNGFQNRRLVVDYINHRIGVGHTAPATAGSVKWKLAPRPLLFAAHNRPPCAATIVRHTARPSPRPCVLVVKNGSNTRSRLWSGMPWPISDTDT